MTARVRAWVPELPRAVWILELGMLVNTLGLGLILPFEVIYLHGHRHFSLPVSGLVLSTTMAVASVASGPAGALVDRYSPKRLLVLGTLLDAAAIAALAFVTAPWQAFLASAVAGAGAGLNGAATPTLTATLTTGEQRTGAFSLQRVTINLGIGIGSLIAGFVVAGGSLRSFQALYLGDAVTFVLFVLVLALVPDVRPATAAAEVDGPRGYRAVLRDRPAVTVLAANVLVVLVAYAFFVSVMPPYVKQAAHVGSRAIGLVYTANTTFIILAQLPIAHRFRNRDRVGVLQIATVVWLVAYLAMIPAPYLGSTAAATAAVAAVAILIGLGECLHAVGIGPLVSDLAPPHLLGRYMAAMALSWSIGIAAGPAVGSTLLAVAPAAPWIFGAVVLLLVLPLLGLVRGRLGEAATAPAAQ